MSKWIAAKIYQNENESENVRMAAAAREIDPWHNQWQAIPQWIRVNPLREPRSHRWATSSSPGPPGRPPGGMAAVAGLYGLGEDRQHRKKQQQQQQHQKEQLEQKEEQKKIAERKLQLREQQLQRNSLDGYGYGKEINIIKTPIDTQIIIKWFS